MKGSRLDARVPEDFTAVPEWRGTARYDVVKCIGAGGMGLVYEAFDRDRGQLVALKTLLRFSPAALYRFKQEFRTLADVVHPNLVSLYELVATDSDHVFFTMELVCGVDFLTYTSGADRASKVNKSETPTLPPPRSTGRSAEEPTHPFDALALPPVPAPSPRRATRSAADYERIRSAMRQLVEGVNALHAAGKLHRDIKPSNVLVTPAGRLVLLDFGVATDLSRVLDEGLADREIVGTARYMAPEQATDVAPSAASDWYSVGAMLYEALVDRPPFAGPPAEVLTRKTLVDPLAPGECADGIPPDLDALACALLRRDPETRPTGYEILRWLGDRSSGGPRHKLSPVPKTPPETEAHVVVRETQQRALREAFDAACQGRLVTVRLHGRSGMGKSVLVERFLDGLVEGGEAVTLRGRVYERESVPYKALDTVIDALSRYLMQLTEQDTSMALPRDMGALAQLFPVLRRIERVGSAPPPAGAGPLNVRRRAIAALRELLAGLAARQPLVLCINDLQWGDTDSAALLVELVRPPFDAPLLIVLTYREEEADSSAFLVDTRARWPIGTDVRDVPVGPLATADARALALTFLGWRDSVAEETADSIARESGGSPLLVEELARSIGRPLRPGGSSPPVVPLGSFRLEKVVEARILVLPPDARRLLELVAVGARPVPTWIVGDAAAVHEKLDEMISTLRGRRFVRTGLRDGREVVEVIHNRIREAILALLSHETLRAHHGRLARVLEAAPDPDAEALAVHLFGAGEKERAARYAERAAEQAASKLAFAQAVRLYRLALDTVGEASADARRLRVRLAEVLERAQRGDEAATMYREAARHAHGFERVELEREAAEQLLLSGHVDEGAAALDRILEAARLRRPRTVLGAVAMFLLYRAALFFVGSRFRVREVRDVRRVDHLRIEALYAVVIGLSFVDVVYGVCMQARHLFLALRAGDRFQVLRAAGIEALNAAARGGAEGARELAFAAVVRRLAGGCDDPDFTAFSEGTGAMRLFLHGRWREARDALLELHERFQTTPAGWNANAHLFGIYATTFLGKMADLRLIHAARLADAEERGDLYTIVNLRIGHSNVVWLVADDVQGARRNVREAMALWSQSGFFLQHYRAMLANASIDLYVGAGARAYEIVTRDWGSLRRSFLTRVQYVRADAYFLRARCALASLSEAPNRNARVREAARFGRKLDGERMMWTAPLASLVWAGVAQARGDRELAISRFREAASRSDAADMHLHAAVARLRLGELLGGAEGGALEQEARAWMTAQDIRVPERIASMLAPEPR